MTVQTACSRICRCPRYLRVSKFFDAFGSDSDDAAHVLGDGDAVVLALFDHVLTHPSRRCHVPLVDGAVRAAADHLGVVVGPDYRSHAVVVTLEIDQDVVGHHRVDLYDVALHSCELMSAVAEAALSSHTPRTCPHRPNPFAFTLYYSDVSN